MRNMCINITMKDPSGRTSKTWVFGHSLAGRVGSITAGNMDVRNLRLFRVDKWKSGCRTDHRPEESYKIWYV